MALMSAGGETFVGYHGTSSSFAPAIRRGIAPTTGRNFGGFAQLGEGFYTTPDRDLALLFAGRAVRDAGGEPVALEVYARDFERIVGWTVPRRL